MKFFVFTVSNPEGITGEAARTLVNDIEKYVSEVTITQDDRKADCHNLADLESLQIKKKDIVRVWIKGPDEDDAIEEIEAYFRMNL